MTINSVVPARLTVGEVLYINIALQNSAPCYMLVENLEAAVVSVQPPIPPA